MHSTACIAAVAAAAAAAVSGCEAGGRYGADCSGVCDCAEGSHCDPVTGRCRCGLGQTGARCELACDALHYGWNCSQRCDCGQHAAACDSVSGCCVCRPGWYGPRCQHGTTAC